MKATLLLCDAAQAVQGKLFVLGGGWSIAGPGPVTMGLAMKIEVPRGQAHQGRDLRLALGPGDGEPVLLPEPDGEPRPVDVAAKFEVGRPPGLRPGTPLDYVMALNIAAMPLPPNQRFEWRLGDDGRPGGGRGVGVAPGGG